MEVSSTRYVLDRWEEAFGVLEGLGPIPRALLPLAAREGDVLLVTVTEDAVTLRLDMAARDKAIREVEALRASLTQAEGSDDDVFEL